VGQILVILMLGSLVFALIESTRLGWTSPVILGLLCVSVLGALGLVGYEPRRADPLLELRFFRSVPFSGAIVSALSSLCAFGAFLFLTTLYLQDVRAMSPLVAGLSLLPVAVPVMLLGPLSGRVVGARGPRLPLAVSGAAMAAGGLASMWLTPATPLVGVLAVYSLFGIALGTVNPPITNSAISGMPASMAGVAGSVASTSRQAGTTLGVAISGTVVGTALSRGGTAFTSAAHGVWWTVAGLGLVVLILGLLTTGPWARRTATRVAALFDDVDTGVASRPPGTAQARRKR
jgi:Na+/melibiose symporter-like transporter